MRPGTLLPLLAGLLACGPSAPSADALAGSRRSVEAAMEHYATLTRTGPVDSIVAAYIPDGELLEPGMNALHGREAIRSFLTPLAAAFTVESASMTSDTVDLHNHVAYQWGRYDQRAGPNGGPVAEYRGRFVAEWHQEADGQWRLARLLVQPFPPPRS